MFIVVGVWVVGFIFISITPFGWALFSVRRGVILLVYKSLWTCLLITIYLLYCYVVYLKHLYIIKTNKLLYLYIYYGWSSIG